MKNTLLKEIEDFQHEIYTYYQNHKRDLEWRNTFDPYCIFISEMMLQQTQVDRVVVKYHDFISRFPTLISVAQSNKTDILKMWQGLGYNRRAIFIKKTCAQLLEEHNSQFPTDFKTLQTLPGIGPSTAGAICAFAFNQPVYFIETNIRAVLLHFFFQGQTLVSDTHILQKLKEVSPFSSTQTHINPRDWYYALYDYGTFLKKKLGGKKTTLHKQSKHYHTQSKFEGSFRQKRAQVLRLLLSQPKIKPQEIKKCLAIPLKEIATIHTSLKKDGLID